MNASEIATKEDINRLQEKINQLIETISKIKSAGKQDQSDEYLTSNDVMKIYKLSKSHLTDLRNEGKIPYSKPFGVLLYSKAEIEKIIKESRLTKN